MWTVGFVGVGSFLALRLTCRGSAGGLLILSIAFALIADAILALLR